MIERGISTLQQQKIQHRKHWFTAPTMNLQPPAWKTLLTDISCVDVYLLICCIRANDQIYE